jgi:N-methylhydantoinase A
MSKYIVAIDVGGTFTDLIGYDTTTNKVSTGKVPSTPPDFIDGMIDGINLLNIAPKDIRLIKIGTTIATNTIIMRTGARTALLTTAGFTDVLHAARAGRPTLYDSDWDPAPALVDRRDTLGIDERITYDGEVLAQLHEGDLETIASVLKDRDIEAVAITFLHSYINGEHERKAQNFLERALNGRYVCISSEILPEVREFERTSTTVANAYLGPVLERYLSKLAQRLELLGYDGPVLITHSGGGVMSIDAARKIPARVCQSGPAAGVVAGANIGRTAGRPNVINLDVGGTSADVSLSKGGKALIRSEWNIDFNITINFASVDVTTIGAGGGSIAYVDDGGVLHVGPRSAGARPGPACYGQGGAEPTVTDANLVLGRLGAQTQLAGRISLRRDLAEKAIDRIATRLGHSRIDAATGLLRIMGANMASGIRLMSVKRGHDPRDFSLVAFGGAGPLHAVELARELRIPEVIIPLVPGCGSALGCLFVDVRHDFVQSIFETSERRDVDRINDAFGKLEASAKERLKAEGVPENEMILQRAIDVRYYAQISGGLSLPVKAGRLTDQDVDDLFAAFHKRHTEEFQYTLPVELVELEIVNARVTAEANRKERIDPSYSLTPKSKPEPILSRDVYFDRAGWIDTPIFRRDELPIDFEISGPAIVEQTDTTSLLPPGTRARVDSSFNLICAVE